MKKKIIMTLGIMAILLSVNIGTVFAAKGYDRYGYNDQASMFNGNMWTWALKIGDSNGWTQQQTLNYLNSWYGAGVQTIGFYEKQKLIMNWNTEWDRGNAEGWTDDYYAAWTTNMYNGINADGTKYNWQYKIIWVGADLENSPYWRVGGYAVWGQFEVIMDKGTSDGVHTLFAHVAPNGLGNIK